MFTGIIETTGQLKSKKKSGDILCCRFAVNSIQKGLKLGDSISTNGVCLTVVGFGKGFIDVDIVEATMKVTSLGSLKVGDAVNFERAMKLNGRMGGHYVQGHVDGVAKLVRKVKKGKNYEFHFELPKKLLKDLIPRASITINGISLTVQSMSKSSFCVALIPHTLEMTNLGRLKNGNRVNIEIDILAKYVRNVIQQGRSSS